MELGVLIIGIILRILNFVLAPLWWRRRRRPLRAPPAEPWLMRSAGELAGAVREGEITSEDLILKYIARVQEVNRHINAVADERYRDALEDAKAIDREILAAKENGGLAQLVKDKPLLGVPFTVKESCSVAGLSNSVGCVERAGRRAAADGAAVARLRRAGAVPLLASNTPELCLGWETTNLLRGTTNNPYDLDCTPGGSSGGEGALLACAASAMSIASDIAGSIRVPAAFCGVFGYKPTPGIIPIEGHVPTLADPQFADYLAVGPMTRYADDLRLLTSVLAAEHYEALRMHEPVDMKELKVYFMTEFSNSIAFLPVESNIKQGIIDAVDYLEKQGATVSNEKFRDMEDAIEMSISMFFSMKDIPNMLQDPADPKRDKSLVLELLKWLLGGGARSLQALGFALLRRTRLFIPEHRQTHYRMKAKQLREQITRSLGARGVLLLPAWRGAAPAHGRTLPAAAAVAYSMLLNALALPAVAVPLRRRGPAGPAALQVVAGPNQDRLCLAVAKQLEVGFGGWKPPN